jgi:shikimate dehydrogenase
MLNDINGYTRTCGLIGNPVEHTLSPVIHNTLSMVLGENLAYVPFHVENGRLEDAIKGAFALNLLGLNVTVPYKSDVIPYLTDIDPLAENIGAVNTLVRTETGYKGYNTDMPGLYRAMCEDGVKVKGEKVLILGAGGVARAVAMLLLDKGAREAILLNRTVQKAQEVADEVNRIAGRKFAKAMPMDAYDTLPAGKGYLAIQATSVGMYPGCDAAVIEDPAFYEKVHTGYDLIFNPPKTRFMELVEAQGGKAYNGAKMLLYQGIIAFELWTGCEIKSWLADKVYERMQEAKKTEDGK